MHIGKGDPGVSHTRYASRVLRQASRVLRHGKHRDNAPLALTALNSLSIVFAWFHNGDSVIIPTRDARTQSALYDIVCRHNGPDFYLRFAPTWRDPNISRPN